MPDDRASPSLPDSGAPTARWDADARALAEATTAALQRDLGEALVSVIVHGSLAMGSYVAPKADVDMLAVVSRPLTPEERRRTHLALLDAHDGRRSGAGLELSVVTAAAARTGDHPMPYELHFACEAEFTDAVRAGTIDYAAFAADPDLAAHVTVARARGVALFGPPPAEVFAPMAWAHYLDALETDLAWALEPGRAAGNPAYLILNACRVLQIDALGEGTVMSKAEGAEWALAALPAQYRGLVAAALAHYLSAEPEGTARLETAAVRKFADFARCRAGAKT